MKTKTVVIHGDPIAVRPLWIEILTLASSTAIKFSDVRRLGGTGTTVSALSDRRLVSEGMSFRGRRTWRTTAKGAAYVAAARKLLA